MGRDVRSLLLSIQHFSLPTTASPTLQGALKDGLGEAVVACGRGPNRRGPIDTAGIKMHSESTSGLGC